MVCGRGVHGLQQRCRARLFCARTCLLCVRTPATSARPDAQCCILFRLAPRVRMPHEHVRTSLHHLCFAAPHHPPPVLHPVWARPGCHDGAAGIAGRLLLPGTVSQAEVAARRPPKAEASAPPPWLPAEARKHAPLLHRGRAGPASPRAAAAGSMLTRSVCPTCASLPTACQVGFGWVLAGYMIACVACSSSVGAHCRLAYAGFTGRCGGGRQRSRVRRRRQQRACANPRLPPLPPPGSPCRSAHLRLAGAASLLRGAPRLAAAAVAPMCRWPLGTQAAASALRCCLPRLQRTFALLWLWL